MADALPPPRIDLLVHSPTPAPYVPVLKLLLEPSPPLESLLAPQLHTRIASLPPQSRPPSYAALVDLAADVVASWDVDDQAAFLAAHPRIGETKNLSTASQGEQAPKQGQQGTPGEVLKRLQVRLLLSITGRRAREHSLTCFAPSVLSLPLRLLARARPLAGPQLALRGRLPRPALHHVRQRPLARRHCPRDRGAPRSRPSPPLFLAVHRTLEL